MTFNPDIMLKAIWAIFGAMPNTLFMAIVSLLSGIVLGAVIAVIRLGHNRVVNGFFAVIISFLRGVPSIVQLFIVYNSLPFLMAPFLSSITGQTVKPFDVSPYWTVYTTFILYNTAYQSETIRGALQSVDRGQYEAAVTVGMSPLKAFLRIIFPQAFIVALPTFFSYYLKTIKVLSLVFTVKVVDMFAQADLFAALYNRRTEAYLADAVVYWVMCIALTFLFHYWEKSLRQQGFVRRPA